MVLRKVVADDEDGGVPALARIAGFIRVPGLVWDIYLSNA